MSYDFAVIGAGMIGSSCAKYLSGFGHRLEKISLTFNSNLFAKTKVLNIFRQRRPDRP